MLSLNRAPRRVLVMPLPGGWPPALLSPEPVGVAVTPLFLPSNLRVFLVSKERR